ncbi:hypothetical protein ACJX0J_007536, partial [Zea mays]
VPFAFVFFLLSSFRHHIALIFFFKCFIMGYDGMGLLHSSRELISIAKEVHNWRPYLWDRIITFIPNQRRSTSPQHTWVSRRFYIDGELHFIFHIDISMDFMDIFPNNYGDVSSLPYRRWVEDLGFGFVYNNKQRRWSDIIVIFMKFFCCAAISE